jgi:hypothetical protein
MDCRSAAEAKKFEPNDQSQAINQLALNFDSPLVVVADTRPITVVHCDFRPKPAKADRANPILKRLRDHAAHLTW